MKKVLLIFALAFAFVMHAQQSYFTVYNFSVNPEDGATVFKLVDDYYSKNKPAGVTVSLYENHLHNSANNYTHSLVFTGSLDAVGNMYGGGPSDSWSLFLTQLQQHETGISSASGMVVSVYGDMNVAHPVQRLLLLNVPDGDAFATGFDKFNSKYTPDGMFVMNGVITTGHMDGVNRWVVLGFKDFKAAFGGPDHLVPDAMRSARDKAWDEYMASIEGARIVHSGLRVLMKAW
jgi:hypothetical protein